ncbi:MAG: FecR domain-containing protein [Pirellulales bacterium]|nr:FecR domain-containing protein [Pirellulales bacterium]
MNEKRFDELLAAYLEGNISEEQLVELHQTVRASQTLRQKFQQETRLHVMLRETLAEQIELRSIQETTVSPRREASRWKYWKYVVAATAVALLASLSGIAYWAGRPDSGSTTNLGICMSVSEGGELLILRGSQRHRATPETPLQVGDRVICDAHTQAMLRLAEGSILAMEAGAELTLVSDRPEVSLQKGEVLFEVAPRDPEVSAFQVLTGQSTVAVMGTVFSLAANGHTELKVYEGKVTFTRHRDRATVNVGSQQMTSTAAEDLAVEDLSLPVSGPSTEILSLLPTDDVTLDRGQRDTDYPLKVEGQRRTVFLRFEVPDVGAVRAARLRLTQHIDPGTGKLRFLVGDHSDWSEDNLSGDNAPQPLRAVAEHVGVVRRGQIVEVDVSDAIGSPGPLTLIMTLDRKRQDDIWFASKESQTPPQLILTYVP